MCFENIQLKPLSKDDSEKYRLLRNIPENRKNFEYSGIITQKEQIEWYSRYLDDNEDLMFSIYLDNGSFAGCNSIYKIDYEAKTAEYGRIIIDNRYSGNGYGYKATVAAMMIAKYQLNLENVYLDVYRDNISALSSYRKAGFIIESIFKDKDQRDMLRMVYNTKQLAY